MLPFPGIRENSGKQSKLRPIAATEPVSSNTRPDARALLEEFIASGRSEASFTEVFQYFGGLVFTSAMRRTGNRQIAEEVTQNVFTILARKAAAVRRHPSPTAWIFQTTKLEAAKLMRSESRKNRKHAALARELSVSVSQEPEDAEAWRDVLPHLDESLDRLGEKDREILLARFFEDQKFSEIAGKTGRTEAACKMRVKRALEKLSHLLAKRGVSLSSTVIATGLAAEFSNVAPISASMIVHSALGASSTLSFTTFTANTLQTMSTIKSVSLASAAVLAVASVPFLWQESEAAKIREEITRLEDRQSQLDQETGDVIRASMALHGSHKQQTRQTIKSLLAAAEEPIDADTLMRQLMEAMMSRDVMGMFRVFIPLAKMDSNEIQKLLADMEAFEGNAEIKSMAIMLISQLNLTADHRDSLERMMKLDLKPHSYSSILTQWASEFPEDAIEWYEQKLQAGDLVGKGVHNTPDKVLFGNLLEGIGRDNPALAAELYIHQDDGDIRDATVWHIARALGNEYIKTDDPSHIELVLAETESPQREQFVNSAIYSFKNKEDFERGIEFAREFLDDPEQVGRTINALIRHDDEQSVAEKADWLVEKLNSEESVSAVVSLARESYHAGSKSEMEEWFASIESSTTRDIGLKELAHMEAHNRSFSEAERLASKITDEEIRGGVEDYIKRRRER